MVRDYLIDRFVLYDRIRKNLNTFDDKEYYYLQKDFDDLIQLRIEEERQREKDINKKKYGDDLYGDSDGN